MLYFRSQFHSETIFYFVYNLFLKSQHVLRRRLVILVYDNERLLFVNLCAPYGSSLKPTLLYHPSSRHLYEATCLDVVRHILVAFAYLSELKRAYYRILEKASCRTHQLH